MPPLNFALTRSFISALRAAPLRPFHTLVRTTEERFRPPQVALHRPADRRTRVTSCDPSVSPDCLGQILREQGTGRVPTIVLGGLVPDSLEQVFLLRRSLLKSGDLYYVNYPRSAFSLDALCAQLSDLIAELVEAGQPPVLFGVSFGAGLVLEWLRRARVAGVPAPLSGIVLVSPVTCVADLLAPGEAKPATLIGRALKPFLETAGPVPAAAVEKSRTVFLRMFEAGAQNKLALRLLMTARESARLREAVMASILGITWEGAQQRVRALAGMRAPVEYFAPALLPLSPAPTLILFAEREDAVLAPGAPGMFALEGAHRAYFPQSSVQRVAARAGEPAVQHASLIFHVFEFLPALQAFYQKVRRGPLPLAA